jgi:hypothetical protein
MGGKKRRKRQAARKSQLSLVMSPLSASDAL